jgi:hypothetical protein
MKNDDAKRLFNQGDCHWLLNILTGCLHEDPKERFGDASIVLDLWQIFERATCDKQVQTLNVHESLNKLRRHFSQSCASLFDRVLEAQLRHVEKQAVETDNSGCVVISGTRDEVIGQLLNLLSHLRSGDLYVGFTLPYIWESYNLGADGRFMTMNEMLAKKGVIIRRVFIVEDNDFSEDKQIHFRRIKHAQLRLLKTAQNNGQNITNPDLKHGGVWVGFAPRDAISELISDDLRYAMIKSRLGNKWEYLFFTFHEDFVGPSDESKRTISPIRKIMIWRQFSEGPEDESEFIQKWHKQFNELVKKSHPIGELPLNDLSKQY